MSGLSLDSLQWPLWCEVTHARGVIFCGEHFGVYYVF